MVTDQIPSKINTESIRDKAKRLVLEKDSLEAQLKELEQDLKNQNVKMDDPLVDADGFPRTDIDVISVRNTRVAIIRMKNDLKSKYEEVEKALIELHQATSTSSNHAPHPISFHPSNNVNINSDSISNPPSTNILPFATVSSVVPGSPAYLAVSTFAESALGLHEGDQLLSFGSLNYENNNSLQALPSFVSSQENREFPISIKRSGRLLQLRLTPRKWEGRGLLGCHIQPTVHTRLP